MNTMSEEMNVRVQKIENALYQHISNYNAYGASLEERVELSTKGSEGVTAALETVKDLNSGRTSRKIRHEEAKHHIPSEWNSDEANKLTRAVGFAKFQKEMKV